MPTPREIALKENAPGTFTDADKAQRIVNEQEKPRERDYRANPTVPPLPAAPCRITRG